MLLQDEDLATRFHFLTQPELSVTLGTALSFLFLHLQKERVGGVPCKCFKICKGKMGAILMVTRCIHTHHLK